MKKSYTETSYYHIKHTARYLQIYTNQIFKKICADISFDEYIALELIDERGVMCQRDLAKLLLKDRANTGRIINVLKEKEYITVVIDEKNNYIVKNITITEKGKIFTEDMRNKLSPIMDIACSQFTDEDNKTLLNLLIKIEDLLKQITKIKI